MVPRPVAAVRAPAAPAATSVLDTAESERQENRAARVLFGDGETTPSRIAASDCARPRSSSVSSRSAPEDATRRRHCPRPLRRTNVPEFGPRSVGAEYSAHRGCALHAAGADAHSHGKTRASFRTARTQYGAPPAGLQARTEAMRTATPGLRRLIGAFHCVSSLRPGEKASY